MNRRGFLHGVECAALGAAAAAFTLPLAGCLGFQYVHGMPVGSRMRVRRTELGELSTALVDVPGLRLPVHLFRRDDGSFGATSTQCTHRGCQVEAVQSRFVCPCHGSEFTQEGAVLHGPAELPLVRFAVTVTDEYVEIDIARGGLG